MTTNNDSLCVQCGLCCDGTLFYGTRLKPSDDRTLTDREGITVLESGRQFAQPCPCLTAKKCRIYDERFAACRSFRCRLLKEVEAGTTSLADAVAVVNNATMLAGAVRQALRAEGVTEPVALSVAMSRRRTQGKTDSRMDLMYGALRALIASRFRNRR